MFFPTFAIVGGDPVAIVRVFARLHLVDQVAHGQRMILPGAEDERLLLLVNQIHEEPHPVLLAFLDLDDLVKILFHVQLPGFNLALDHRVIGCVNVFIQRRGDFPHLERRQETIVDAFLERVDVDRFAKIGVGVHVLFAFGRGGHAQLHGLGKVFEDAAPRALIVRTAPVTFVNCNEIEEVRWILAEIRRRLAVFRRAAHERLEDREEDTAVHRHFALLADVLRFNPHHRIVGERGKRREIIERLVRQIVPVCEKQDARTARRLVAQIPSSLKQLPSDLKGDGGLAGAGRERQQDTVITFRDFIEYPVGGNFLIITNRPTPALIGKRHHGKSVPPRVLFGKRHLPEFVRGRVPRDLAFLAGFHVHGVDALAVGGVGEPHRQFLRVLFRLSDAFRQRFIPRLGLIHGQHPIAIFQHIIGFQLLPTPPGTFETAQRDLIGPANPAAFNNAPTGSGQLLVNVLGSGFGFVHGFLK